MYDPESVRKNEKREGESCRWVYDRDGEIAYTSPQKIRRFLLLLGSVKRCRYPRLSVGFHPLAFKQETYRVDIGIMLCPYPGQTAYISAAPRGLAGDGSPLIVIFITYRDPALI